MNKPIGIMLVDDYGPVHRSLEVINDICPDLRVIAHASTGQEAIQLCDDKQPDVILMDVIMPYMNGIEATRIIHGRHPDIKILALSSFQDETCVQDMIEAGAVGYVLKNTSLKSLVDAVQAVRTGQTIFSPEVPHTLLNLKVAKARASASDWQPPHVHLNCWW